MNLSPTTDLWQYLKKTDKPILMYGMGNGADKILAVCEKYGIEISDFFASDGFVRGHSFHGKVVLSYSEAKARYGSLLVLLSFASSLPDVLATIHRVAAENELYAPDVPVFGSNLFNLSVPTRPPSVRRTSFLGTSNRKKPSPTSFATS